MTREGPSGLSLPLGLSAREGVAYTRVCPDGGIPVGADERRQTIPKLPPEETTPGRVLTVPGAVVQQFEPHDVVIDAVTAVDPDVIIPTAPDAAVVKPSLAGDVAVPVLTTGRGMQVNTVSAADDHVIIAVLPTPEDLPATPTDLLDEHASNVPAEERTAARGLPQVCLVTDVLSLRVNPHQRTTALEDISRYVEALPDAWRTADVTHVSTALRPSYAKTYAGPATETPLSIHGAGTSDARLGVGVDDSRYPMAVLDVYPNGAVLTDTLSPDRFGLRGLDGVSETLARRLREAGLADRQAVAAAPRSALTAIPSIGEATATKLQASARAVADQEVVPTGDGSLPNGDPVFIDIETDGLAASTAWLVGVLDGDAEQGNYLAFRQPDPERPAEHLEAFMTWLTGSARGRPVVAWNGYGFDFGIIREQLRQHYPGYVDDWDACYQFDPLYWAETQGNAALPGRTNELERVARALGWKPTTTGLDGATVAEIYIRWRDRIETAADPASVPEPDWDRLEAYCEDDVRALATIYDALADAARRPPETPTPTDGESTQGSLSDFT